MQRLWQVPRGVARRSGDEGRSGRRSSLVAVVVAGSLLAAGCGNAKSTEELVQEALAGNQITVSGGQTAPGAVDVGGIPVDGAAAAPGAVGAAPAATGGTSAVAAPGAGSGSAGAQAGGTTKATAGGGGAPAAGVKAGTAGCTGPKSPVVIGGVGQLTGVLGTLFSGGAKAVSAWVAATNAAGGLKCHPLKYISLDDGGDPSRHLALVRRLVEQDKVAAMVYQSALITGQASKDYILSKKMPVIGQEGAEQHWTESPLFFDHSTAGKSLVDWTIVAGARAAIGEGKKVLGTLTCQEVVYCTVSDSSWKELGVKLGLKPVYTGKASLLNVDFTSQCLAAKNAGVEVLGLAFDTAAIERIAQSCSAVNFKPLFFYTSVQSNLSFTGNPNLADSVIAQPLRPWFLTEHPEIREFQAAIKKYAPGLAIDSSSLNGWAAGTLFERAAPAFEADTVTPEAILKAMWQVKNDDMDGLSWPQTYTEGKPYVRKVCGWIVRVRPGKFETDGKMSCL